MKVSIISRSDSGGGAFRAAYRLHKALISNNTSSHMQVRIKGTTDDTVIGPSNAVATAINRYRSKFGIILNQLQRTKNINLHSGNWLPSNWSDELNQIDSDVINLHWVAGETLSIEDIGNIKKPIVWSLHDMWPFCGTEHITDYTSFPRWEKGYSIENKPDGHQGFDLDRLVWSRKKAAWKYPMEIVTPSTWLENCVKRSKLFSEWPTTVIPNVLDTSIFKPSDRLECCRRLNLPTEKHIILFGAVGGSKDPNKGFDLLVNALWFLAQNFDNDSIQCVVFGQSEPKQKTPLPFPIIWMGNIDDDTKLAQLYSAAKLMIVPSRQENLPQTATEAQACGCPVIAFNSSGIPDAVVHGQTGYLAEAYDPYDMAEGIKWMLENESIRKDFSAAAHERAISLWSPKVVISKYISIYEKAIETHKS